MFDSARKRFRAHRWTKVAELNMRFGWTSFRRYSLNKLPLTVWMLETLFFLFLFVVIPFILDVRLHLRLLACIKLSHRLSTEGCCRGQRCGKSVSLGIGEAPPHSVLLLYAAKYRFESSFSGSQSPASHCLVRCCGKKGVTRDQRGGVSYRDVYCRTLYLHIRQRRQRYGRPKDQSSKRAAQPPSIAVKKGVRSHCMGTSSCRAKHLVGLVLDLILL